MSRGRSRSCIYNVTYLLARDASFREQIGRVSAWDMIASTICVFLCVFARGKIDAPRYRVAADKFSALCSLMRATNATSACYVAIKINVFPGRSAEERDPRAVVSLATENCFEIRAMTRQFFSPRVIKSPSAFSRGLFYARGYLTLL